MKEWKKLVIISNGYLTNWLMLNKVLIVLVLWSGLVLSGLVYYMEYSLHLKESNEILIDEVNDLYCNPDTIVIKKEKQVKTVSISYNSNKLTQKDLEVLEVLVYTESGKSNQFEWDLILETILYRYYMSKEKSLLSYVKNNKYVFQGWLNKHQYYQAKAGTWYDKKGKKITCKSCNAKVSLINKRIIARLKKGQARPIKYYHRTMKVDSVFLGGKKRPLNKKHYAYVKNLTKKGHLYKLKADNLLHDFYELPKERIPKGYIKWRNNLN